MTVTFSIRNVTDDLVETVMLRKFFQMVFVGNNRKSLHIYTATVLGGHNAQASKGSDESAQSEGTGANSNESTQSEDAGASPKEMDPKTEYVSQLNTLKEFCIRFGFVVTGNDDNDVLSITSQDITDEESGFLRQIDCIQQVWGKQCKVLQSDQKDLTEKYQQFTGKDDKAIDNTIRRALAQMAQGPVLWIEDENKSQEPEMFSLAVQGYCTAENYPLEKGCVPKTKRVKLADEGSEKASYCIKVPEHQCYCEGIELLNWVKTTIQFKYHLTDHNLNFCIKKEPASMTSFIAPDFTWYFSPPVKSFINHESSCAEVSWRRQGEQSCEQHKSCQCPIKPDAGAPYTSKRYDNVVNPVANKTTVNFSRWLNDEMIGYRQKYRIASKNIISRPELFGSIRELNIFIDTSDEHGRGNRQYVLGLLISFALAFGIDKTRLSDAQVYFPLEKLFLADTWWLLLIISLSMNMLIRPPRSIHERRYIRWRKWNIICALVWIIFVFCVDRSEWLMNLFYSYVANPVTGWIGTLITFSVDFYVIPRFIFVVILCSNALYVIKNIIKYHDPILTGLFGDDIL